MILTAADRVQEFAQNIAASGSITLLGATAADLITFAQGGLNGKTVPYTIEHEASDQWEIGLGVYTASGTTLTRAVVLANSSGTTVPINFAAGVVNVWVDLPAEKAVMYDADTDHVTLRAGLSIAGAFDGVTTVHASGAVTLDNAALSIRGVAYTWPATQAANRYLKTDGAGNLTWATILETIALTDLSDVTITTPSAGQMLAYNGAGLWINSSDGTALTISASNLSTGTVPTGRMSGAYAGITGLGTVASGTWNASVIVTTYGGTGLAAWTAGDVPYYASGTALSKLGIGTAAQFFNVNAGGTAPQWHTLVTADVTDLTSAATGITKVGTVTTGVWNATVVTTTYGGTGLSTYAVGDLLYFAAGTTLTKLPIGTALQYVRTNAGATAPEWHTLTAADIGSGQALTKGDDTNVTLTLGGTPGTALLVAASITAGWTGTLAAARLNANVVQAVTNDTNVTGSIATQTLTLGWTGTLAAGRLNANVVQAITNDTNVTGSITAQNLTLAWSGQLGVARGGTGLATFTAAGGTLYATAATTLAVLAIGTATQYYRVNAGATAPEWHTITAADITAGQALTKADDTNVTLTLGGTPATALLAASSITAGWTGTLAAARLNANVVQSVVNDTNVTGSISAQALTLGWTSQLSVSRGGTGLATFTAAGGMAYATAATTLTVLAIGAANTVMTSSGSAPQWSTSLNLAGSLAVGTTSVLTGVVSIGSAAGQFSATVQALQVNTLSTANARWSRSGADINAVALAAVKSRGASIGALAKLVAGDAIFQLTGIGVADDNTTLSTAAQYVMAVPIGGVPAAGTTVAADHQWLTTNIAGTNAVRMWLSSEGVLAIGGGYAQFGATTQPFQLNALSATPIRVSRSGNDTGGANMVFIKSRGAAIGTSAAVVAGDTLWTMSSNGIAGDNSTIATAAQIIMTVPTSGVATTTVAGQITFTTTNLAGTLANRLILTSEGVVTAAADNTYALGTASLRWSDFQAVTATFGGRINAGASGGAVSNFASGIRITGAVSSFASGVIYQDSGQGMTIGAITGSVNDFLLADPSGNAIMSVPTGTKGVTFATSVQALGSSFDPAASTTQMLMRNRSGAPTLSFVDSTQSANARIAEFIFASGSFVGRYVNDAYAAATTWLAVVGTSASITSIALTGTTAIAGVVTNTAVLTVTGFDASASPLIVFQRSGGGVAGSIKYDGTTQTAMQFGTTTNHGIALFTNGTVGLTITNGQVVAMPHYGAGTATFDASGNITSVSDERHKTDIRSFSSGLKELRNVRPILHRYNQLSGMETEHTYPGFSAQNVREFLPEAIFERASDGMLSLYDRGILAALVNAVKELDTRTAALAA